MIRLLFALWLAVAAVACDRGGPAVPRDVKVVPNEEPEPALETREPTALISTADLRPLSDRQREEAAEPKQPGNGGTQQPGNQETRNPGNPDTKIPANPESTSQTGLDAEASREDQLDEVLERYRERLDRLRQQRAADHQAGQAGRAAKQEQPRSGGARPFAAQSRPQPAKSLTGTFPPGRFFKARLTGKVEVTAFPPPVWAEVYGPDGRLLGTAIGKASLHRTLTNRAVLSFSHVEFSGVTLGGSLTGLDLDLSLGLRGHVQRRNVKRVAAAIAETLLAALSLDVRGVSDTFAGLFRVNLTNRLVDHAQGEIRALDLDRIVTLERGQAFWITAAGETQVREAAVSGLEPLARHAREALAQTLDGQDLGASRRAALMRAYRDLEARLQAP